MNSSKIVFQFSFLLVLMSVFHVQAMYYPLCKFEKQLVVREIERRGIESVRQDVYNSGEPELLSDGVRMGWKFPVILDIETTFKAADAETDPLAKAVFEAIQSRELADGYVPEDTMVDDKHCIPYTNCIGFSTRYYWLEEKGVRLPAVRVKSAFDGKPSLKKIVDKYSKQKEHK